MLKLHSLRVLLVALLIISSRLAAQPCSTSDLAAQASGVAPTTCGNCDGSASVAATGGTGPYTYFWSTGDTTPTIGTTISGAPLCINTGGGQLVATSGNTFTDDQFFSGGTTFSNAIPIANTNDDALFQDERFVGNGGFFSYNIPVTNGNYLVELYFAEIFFGTSPTRPGGVGSRLFDVSIEGALVLDDYDIFLDAGGPAIAIIKSFNVNVTDGTLSILFDGVVNNAKINALCVTPISSTGSLCSGTYAVTVTDALGCTATTDVTLVPGACNDNNSCTTDTCANDQCIFTAIICDDGDACTADSCFNGSCTFTAIPGCGDPCFGVTCDDGDACTTDACDNGNCVFTNIPGCNDPCANSTLALSFSVQNACIGDTAIITNNSVGVDPSATFYLDQNSDGSIDNTFPAAAFPIGASQNRVLQQPNESFTLIAENPDGCTDTVVVTFTAVVCDDGDACTSDNCSNNACSFPAITCDDGDLCTTDACNNGNCVFTNIPGCNDPCANSTLALSFSVQNACIGDTAIITNNSVGVDPSATFYLDQNSDGSIDNTFPAAAFPIGASQNRVLQQPNESFTLIAENPDGCTDTVVVTFTAVVCDDGDACTSDNCSNNTCSFPAITCDDGDLCTTDACNNGTCSNVAIDCDDNDACTADSCNGGTCSNTQIPGCSDPCTSLNCDDNDACTTDGCANGTCTYTSACDDNDACTMETCHYENDDDDDDGHWHGHGHHHHHHGGCPDDDDDDNTSYHCHVRDVHCDDNNRCTTDECVNGVCVFTPKVCDDNDLCTNNSCYRGNCIFQEISCKDNDACTFDSCGAGICYNIVRNCEEGDLCTVDYCVPHSHPIDDRIWDLLEWFNFNSRYRHTTCVHQPINCSDGNACTTDACNAGNCTNTAIASCCATDSDCNDNDPCTEDKCRSNRTCRYTSDPLDIDEQQSSCQNGTVTLETSEPGASYLWSTGETTETIEGTAGTAYSVTVTLASGCVKTASITVSNGADLLSSYVILAEEEVRMSRNTVLRGGVGVTDNNGRVRLKDQTKIIAASTFVRADHVQLSSGSQATTVNPNPANVDLPAFETNPYCNWSSNSINVGQNQNITLSGSVYNNINVNKNATVTFTSPNVNIKSLYLKDNVTVHFASCSRVKICKWLRLGADNTFNPGQADVVVFVEDQVEIGAGSTVFADIYLRDGWFRVNASAANDPTRLTGLFIAERFDAAANALWAADTTCNSACAPSFQQLIAAKLSEESVEDAGGVESAFTMDDITNGVHLKSYPNPFTDKLNIEFALDTDTRAKLEVYNLTGQLIAILFDGNVTGGAVQRFEFTPQTNAEGVYIYRLQTATETYVGKAMMVR